MRSIKYNLLLLVILLFALNTFAENNPKRNTKNSSTSELADCEPAKSSTELYVNNVRALIQTGGDMWWDLNASPKYEVPAGSGRHIAMAGALWIGGKDSNGQLKLAAQMFRQNGNDYWPGPLIMSGENQASTTKEVCRQFDRHFVITREMVKEFRDWYACSNNPDCDVNKEFPYYTIPDIIMNWPVHGPAGGYDYYLAPFWDADNDGKYDPLSGDFPYFEFINEGITDDPDCLRPRNRMPKLFGDKTLWWVFNDAGNTHTESGASAIGLEIRAQAFAFSTNDEINNMTFYNYNIINRSTYTLYDTYIGIWTNANIGNPYDDYLGCDVERGLGYAYNGNDFDANSGGYLGYGNQPPAFGIDFFEGPYKDPDGTDNPTSYDTINGEKVLNCNKGDILNGNINGLNFGDGIVDNERWGMTNFMYHTGLGHGPTGFPDQPIHYYNYLTSKWKNETPLLYGGSGLSGSGADENVPTRFAFPGDPSSDKCGWGQNGNIMPGWSEISENHPPNDVRFVQSSGPFKLKPGAVNDITIGAIYARAFNGGAWQSVVALQKADDKAQILFENCFRVLEGPDAPELKIIEMDKKLIVHIYNKPNSNNYLEQYAEKDPSIICNDEIEPCDTEYRFQGYQVFQLKDKNVSIDDRHNNDLVRQVFQCDIKDDVSQIINFVWSDEYKLNQPIVEVIGENKGIQHSFVIDKDMFGTNSSKLVNHKEYYYTAIAYSHNNTMPYNQQVPESYSGQKYPYLASKRNIKTYTAMPHINDTESGGTVLQSDYGQGVEITQIEGVGNSYNVLELSDESVEEIMSGYPWRAKTPKYKTGKGPVNIKIIDPLNLPADTYTIKLTEVQNWTYGLIKPGAKWFIYNSNGDTIWNEQAVNLNAYEQIFPEWGISVNIQQSDFAANKNKAENNGFLEASIEFENIKTPWLEFLPDADGHDAYNWIRSGTYKNKAGEPNEDKNYDDYVGFDNNEVYENVLGGTWAPYNLCSEFKYGPALRQARLAQGIDKTEQISSIDLYITSDKSKWSRSCVIEMCENEWTLNNYGHEIQVTPLVNHLSEGNALRFTLRNSPSVDKEGNPLNDGTIGLGWFPGYAIDVRTGERLNIMFGEDSWLVSDNGKDMKWNPTGKIYESNHPVFGGKHYIWIMGHNQNPAAPSYQSTPYDSCANIHQLLMDYNETGVAQKLTTAWRSAMWAAIPLQNPDYEFLACDVKIRLRVVSPYYKVLNDLAKENPQNDNLPMYSFNTSEFKTIINNTDKAKSALDLINIVPNPYYGYSSFGQIHLDKHVRITNLPQKCTISIYSISGKLVRRFEKNDNSTYLDWDLKNNSDYLISDGLYIIHINAPNLGEKIIRWYGTIYPKE